MCFSAPASFVTSGALLVIGSLAMHKASTRPQRVFAAIPLMFAVQQFLEGFLWIGLCSGTSPGWLAVALYGYLIFAWMFWPIHIPVSMMVLEPDPKRKRLLWINVFFGIVVSLCLGIVLLARDVTASVSAHHIAYDHDTSMLVANIVSLFYMVATVFAPFMSSLRKIKWIGVINLVSVMVSFIWFKDYFISVWCYFAAVISVLVVWIIYDLNKQQDKA